MCRHRRYTKDTLNQTCADSGKVQRTSWTRHVLIVAKYKGHSEPVMCRHRQSPKDALNQTCADSGEVHRTPWTTHVQTSAKYKQHLEPDLCRHRTPVQRTPWSRHVQTYRRSTKDTLNQTVQTYIVNTADIYITSVSSVDSRLGKPYEPQFPPKQLRGQQVKLPTSPINRHSRNGPPSEAEDWAGNRCLV